MMDMRLCSAFRNVKGFFDVGAAIAFGEQLGDLFFAFAEAVRNFEKPRRTTSSLQAACEAEKAMNSVAFSAKANSTVRAELAGGKPVAA